MGQSVKFGMAERPTPQPPHKRVFLVTDGGHRSFSASLRNWHCLLHRDRIAHRIDDGRARPTRQAAQTRMGVGYWVVVDFDMNIIDFLVTLNVTVSRMINWRNTASQIGHTSPIKRGWLLRSFSLSS